MLPFEIITILHSGINGDHYVYQLGDASNDLKKIDFSWAGHGGSYERRITANSSYLFLYDGSETYKRLTRINQTAQTCFHLFSSSVGVNCSGVATDTMYDMVNDPTVTENGIVRFCGRRWTERDNGQLYLVQINDAHTSSPDFKSTPVTTCEQLQNLE